MFIFVCNYKSTKFPTTQLMYLLCKAMSELTINEFNNKW
jgi:hypothetical protein